MVPRERKVRFAVLPLSAGCASRSSVDVIESRPKPRHESAASALMAMIPKDGRSSLRKEPIGRRIKGGSSPTPLQKQPWTTNLTSGLHRALESFKTSSLLFTFSRGFDDGAELDIGHPTDVRHVAHIGYDAFNGSDGFEKSSEIFSSLPFRHFEKAQHGEKMELN